MNEPLVPSIDPLAQIAQCMRDTPDDHPEAKEIHAKAEKLSKNTMSTTTEIPIAEAEYIESGTFQGGEEDVYLASIEMGEDCICVSAKYRPLIAAAPDLLAALKLVSDNYNGQLDCLRDVMPNIEAAIQKASV